MQSIVPSSIYWTNCFPQSFIDLVLEQINYRKEFVADAIDYVFRDFVEVRVPGTPLLFREPCCVFDKLNEWSKSNRTSTPTKSSGSTVEVGPAAKPAEGDGIEDSELKAAGTPTQSRFWSARVTPSAPEVKGKGVDDLGEVESPKLVPRSVSDDVEEGPSTEKKKPRQYEYLSLSVSSFPYRRWILRHLNVSRSHTFPPIL